MSDISSEALEKAQNKVKQLVPNAKVDIKVRSPAPQQPVSLQSIC